MTRTVQDSVYPIRKETSSSKLTPYHALAYLGGILTGIALGMLLHSSLECGQAQVTPSRSNTWGPSIQTVPSDSVIVEEIVSVYDGDTFTVHIPQWPDIVGKKISIRLNGIDTPERRGTSDDIKLLAAEARRITEEFIRGGDVVELRNIDRGKYFRLIADVYVDNELLADVLLDKGLAKAYDGKSTRPQWTQEDYNDYFGTDPEASN